MVNGKDFGERIQKLMEHYQLSASAFAEAIDTGRSSISHILSGRNKPSLDFILKITETYPEVDIYWLLNGKGTFPRKLSSSPPYSDPNLKEEGHTTEIVRPPNSTDQDLFSSIDQNTGKKDIPFNSETPGTISKNRISQKKINQIVIFYTDGTFESFKEHTV